MKIININWTKVISIFLFIILTAAYARTFAVFYPGETLDPTCAPGVSGCIVGTLPTQTGNSGKYLTTDGTNASWNSTPVGVTASSVETFTNKNLTSGTNTFPIFNQNTTGNAGTVTTNANLTGVVTSVGNATSIANGVITNAMLANNAIVNLSGINSGDETNATIKTKLGITTLSGSNTGDQDLSGLIPYTGATATLHLKAGTATAGTAPLKFTAGTNLGTAEAGTIEYDGKSFFVSAPVRVGISTYLGIDSQGDNIFVGGGGQNSIGAVGETHKGSNNVSFGSNALLNNTTGYFNASIGGYSMLNNTTGFYNVGVGPFSLGLNSTGTYNIAVGPYSLYQNTDSFNVGIGFGALGASTTGTYGIAIGDNALGGNITGDGNMGIGVDSGKFIADGTTLNTTGGNSMFLGYATKAAADNGQNEIVIGYNTTGNGSNTTTIGTGNVLYVGGSSVSGKVARFTSDAGYCDINPLTTSLSCSSDISLKKNIVTLDDEEFALQTIGEIADGNILDKIMRLTPVKYNWNKEKEGDSKHAGFIAQEMEQIFPDLVATDQNTGLKSIAYANITPYLVKSIQEMNLKIDNILSLDANSSTSLGYLVKSFLGNIGNNIDIVFFGEIRTKRLCLDDLCIDKVQLQEILNNNSMYASVNNPNTNNTESSQTPILNTETTDTDNTEEKGAINSEDNGNMGTTNNPDGVNTNTDTSATQEQKSTSTDSANSSN